VDEVKKTFKSQTRKQRLYIMVDCLSLIPMAWMFLYYWSEFPPLVRILNVGLIVFILPLLGYQLWLRRVAAFGSNAQTKNHVQQLKKQFKNNARIAFINKHSAWLAVLIVIAFNTIFTLAKAAEEREYGVVLLVTAVTAGIMAVWYVWAHRRQKQFEKKLTALNDMSDGD
jgi:Na+/H+ antiporter NhaB